MNSDILEFKHPMATVILSSSKKRIQVTTNGVVHELKSIADLKPLLTKHVNEQYANDLFKEVIGKI